MQRKNSGRALIEFIIVIIAGILAAVVVPVFIGWTKSKQSTKQQPLLAVGTEVLVPDDFPYVTVRNLQPVTNLYGATFPDGHECEAIEDSTLETLGTEGNLTMFRVKTLDRAWKGKQEVMTCPPGTVFFLSKEETKKLVEYSSRFMEKQRQDKRERAAARRLLAPKDECKAKSHCQCR